MRACVMRHGALVVDDVGDPRPEPGQMLVRVLACGICGSDLHFLRHGRAMVAMTDEMRPSMGSPGMGMAPIDLDRDIVMGHEFCAEVVELGPGTEGPPAGTRVVSVPVVLSSTGLHQLAYNNEYPGGYGRYMVLSPALALAVPNGLDTRRAALTEPLAVGMHAVTRSGAAAGHSAVVVGCGPVGLAVVAALAAAGVEPVVAADPSPARRAVALALGAAEAVDPAAEGAVDAWRRLGAPRPLAVFEAVGVPGMLQQLLHDVPPGTTVTVVGVCMEPDRILPFFAIAKELTVQFVLAYGAEEFAGALAALADGVIDLSPMITGTVGLEDVPAAFEALGRPDEHVKILVEPAPS